MMYPLAKDFVAFIKERENIRVKKEAGARRPWTKDEILGTYRFCNIHREDDSVSRFVRSWIGRWASVHNQWFASIVAVLINYPPSLDAIKPYVIPFTPEKMRKVLRARQDAGELVFNAAYIVSTNGLPMNKIDYIIDKVLTPIWEAKFLLHPKNHDCTGWHTALMEYDGMGSFLAAQAVAIMKYEQPLRKARDFATFAADGPGSRRGLNRVMGVKAETGWKRGAWKEALDGLMLAVALPLDKAGISLHAQDLQNCLCEFDKYRRAVEGGRPKQIYAPKGEW